MADSYLQFSEVLVDGLTAEEKAWLEKNLNVERLENQAKLDHGNQYLALTEWVRDSGSLGFEYSLEDDCWVVFEEEYGEPEAVSIIAQAFLRQFRPQDTIGFTWAETCSKLRIGEFGGGGCVIEADAVHFFNAHQWVDEKRGEVSKRAKGK